jgi:hypothetical protein
MAKRGEIMAFIKVIFEIEKIIECDSISEAVIEARNNVNRSDLHKTNAYMLSEADLNSARNKRLIEGRPLK